MGHNLPYRTTIPAQPTTPHHTIASYVRPRAPTHRPQSWWCCTTQGWGRHHLGSGADTLFDANSKPHILPPPPLKTDMFQQINIDHFYKTKMRHASHLRDVICSCRSFCRNLMSQRIEWRNMRAETHTCKGGNGHIYLVSVRHIYNYSCMPGGSFRH